MSEKENLRWIAVGIVISSSITILYDIFQEIFKSQNVPIVGVKVYAGLISLFIGLGLILYWIVLGKIRGKPR